VLKSNFVKTKTKEKSLVIEKTQLIDIDRKRGEDEVHQMKEADTVISDMTELLRKRETEINILIEENK
jgi:hypothetical protein